MDVKLYSEKRDELLKLLNSIVNVDGLKEREKEGFLATRKQLVENQFNIVLIGEFQGGKSTTFNAMCGGREISPRGAMTKTSAICMTATNLSDLSKEEHAIVSWKSNSDLNDMLSEVLKYFSTMADELGLKNEEIENFTDHFDFSNASHISALRRLLDELQSNDSIASKDELIEIIRMAYLVISFYGSPVLKEYSQRESFKIEDVAKIAVFPAEWETRWQNIHTFDDIKKTFKPEESLFVFVGEIQCFIHSINLARLGCSLTDCPGLFASKFDTSVAIKAMSSANAVIYLLSGSKQIGESDERAIKEVMRHQSLRNKVFFAMNTRENKTITENVRKADEARIKAIGVSDVTISDFNVLLFFLSEFGRSLLSGSVDNHTRQQFLSVARNNGIEGETIEECWINIAKTCGFRIGDKTLSSIQTVDMDVIESVRKVSKCEKVITGIEDSIVTQKAKSILLDNGACKIKSSLDSIASRLSEEERLAQISVDERENEYASAIQAYETFKNDVHDILSSAFPDSIVNNIATSAYHEIITESKMAERLARRISSNVNSMLDFKLRAKIVAGKFTGNDEEVRSIFAPIVKRAVEEEVGKDVSVWVNTMINGEHELYKINILPQLEIVANRINNKWEDIVANSNPFIDGYQLPSIDMDNPSEYINMRGVIDAIQTDVLAEMGEVVGDIAGKIFGIVVGFIVGLVIDILLTGGIMMIIGAIIGGLTGRNPFGNSEEKQNKAILSRLNSIFEDSENRKNIIKGLAKCPKAIFVAFSAYYTTQLDETEANLRSDIEEKRDAQLDSVEKQREIAERARAIRETQIEPLTTQLNSFMDSCINI